MENKENRKMRQNKFQNVSSLADIEQENRVTISYIKERCPKERELNALKEEFEQIESAEEKMRQQFTEKQKNILQIDEDNTFRSNAYKNNKDHEKQLRKSVHSLKNEIGLLNRDPLTERDQEKLLICNKQLFRIQEQSMSVPFKLTRTAMLRRHCGLKVPKVVSCSVLSTQLENPIK
ncbi:Protein of unknown function [Gryllus bimaculatus]|nr:Protein of unknown function [Gryllus bimaculatus]